MQEAVPEGQGAMAAVLGLGADAVAAACAEASAEDGVCQPANDNGAGQIVISGHKVAVDRAAPLLKARGAKLVKALPVSAPFHSALMAPAAERLREELDRVEIQAPGPVVIANIDARPYPGEGGAAVRERLYRQVTGTVRWQETMAALVAAGMSAAVEVGPGRVLAGLLKREAPQVPLAGFAEPAQLAAVREMLGGAP